MPDRWNDSRWGVQEFDIEKDSEEESEENSSPFSAIIEQIATNNEAGQTLLEQLDSEDDFEAEDPWEGDKWK